MAPCMAPIAPASNPPAEAFENSRTDSICGWRKQHKKRNYGTHQGKSGSSRRDAQGSLRTLCCALRTAPAIMAMPLGCPQSAMLSDGVGSHRTRADGHKIVVVRRREVSSVKSNAAPPTRGRPLGRKSQKTKQPANFMQTLRIQSTNVAASALAVLSRFGQQL